MLKSLRLQNQTLLIDWTPETVCALLQQPGLAGRVLAQTTLKDSKKLARELFLLATRASLSGQPHIQALEPVLAHHARLLARLCHQRAQSKRGNTMQTNQEHPSQNEFPSLDGLQARLFRLLTQYSMHPCRHLASHIVQALTHLCQHPHIELVPEQRHIYSQSLNMWRSRLLQPVNSLSNQVH